MSTATIGPISGINYGALITGLTADDQSQIDAITTRTTTIDKQSSALTDLASLMTGLQISSGAFTSAGVFKATTAAASNPSIINPTAGNGTPVGNYSFTVQQLASASQVVTQGFSSSNSALGLSGKISLRLGGGTLDNSAQLSSLNGGTGVARGTIRVTDKSGASSLIDLSDDVDINDVVNSLNSATGVSISAAIKDDHLVITDTSGGSGTLTIGNTGGTTTASDLGLTAPSSGTTLTGASITSLKGTTALTSLNDGLGVRIAGGVGDFAINVAAGTFQVNLTGAKTIADVISKINTAGQSDGVSAAVSASGNGITLSNSAGGPISVTSVNASNAASDLGLVGSSSTGTLVGSQITSTLQSPLLKDLNGGDQGQPGEILPQLGTITINGTSVDLSAAQNVNDVLDAINASGTGVTAALNDAGTGINLSSSAASFNVADSTGNLASFLHIAGTSTANATGSGISSGDEHLRYISENSPVAALSGGGGFNAGKISLTDGKGQTATVDLSNASTVGDVLKAINNSGVAISARINDTGDGILLTQTSGTGTGSVKDLDSTQTAESLGIAGSFSSGKLDGTLLKTVNVVATDTLSTLSQKINNAGNGVASAIINDGSDSSPFRLSLSSRNSGAAGRLVLDTSAVGLSTTTLVQGEDAVLVYGSNSKGTGGLITTSSTNAITGLVPGLTLNLTGVGQTSVSVTQDTSQIGTAVQSFVDSYNKIVTTTATDTNFDSSDPTQNGVLFGNSTAQAIQQALGSFITQNYSGLGQFTSLASVGITIGQDGTLTLDTNQLTQALATNPDDVRSLFTTNVAASTGGPVTLTNSTALSSLSGASGFPGGHISITDGFGTAYDVDLSKASTIGNVISAINTATGSKVTAGINAAGDGLTLTQWGGTGTASVSEVGGGTTASTLNIKGTFVNSQLTGHFLPTPSTPAQQGVGATLSNLILQFTDSSTGTIFEATDALSTQETELKSRQTDLATLLTAKKNSLIQTFANLEVTISQLQSQGTSLNSLAASTAAAKT